MSAITPSKYQQAIYDWIETGDGCAVVTAVAGSGKTTTLVEAARRTRREGLFLAFNKAIVAELSPRLAGTGFAVQTCHSAGFAVLRASSTLRVELDSYKYSSETRGWGTRAARELRWSNQATRTAQSVVRRLWDLARSTLALESGVSAVDLAVERGIREDPSLLRWIEKNGVLRRLADWGVAEYEARGVIDFADMIWLPAALGLEPARKHDFIFVDECQDLSAAQRALVHSLRADGGRVLFVGDRRQAIYGFAGADCASVDEIVVEFCAAELPLSICYRCPESHLALAREVVPSIEARDGAPAGEVHHIPERDLPRMVRPKDLVLCRTTAPLVAACLKLISSRVPAVLRGRGVGDQIRDYLSASADHVAGDFSRAGEGVSRERAVRYEAISRLPEERREDALQGVTDLFEAACALLEGWHGQGGWAGLDADVAGLFTDDDDRGRVVLSSVHRAKGLEADRVFILRPEKLPLRWKGQTPEQFEQEMNLKYVALTRSRSTLTLVETVEAE